MTDRRPSLMPQARPPAPLFVERHTYRRRRLMDAARLLPLLGLMLWAVPLLWQTPEEGGIATSTALKYIFAVWALLIAAACLLSLRLRRRSGDDDPSGGSG